MRAPRTAHLLSVAIATLALSACEFDCGTVSRTIANGTVRDASGVALATVTATASEEIGPTYFRLGVGVTGLGSTGEPLRGHVTRARLVSESGELIAEIPTGTETLYLTVVVARNEILPSRAEYDRVRGALLTSRSRVILDTNLPGREHIETVLSEVNEKAGTVQKCRFN